MNDGLGIEIRNILNDLFIYRRKRVNNTYNTRGSHQIAAKNEKAIASVLLLFLTDPILLYYLYYIVLKAAYSPSDIIKNEFKLDL